MVTKSLKIAVIIPAYNVEKRLKICLDSIFCQNYSNFIVVLVNDGSTDRTYEIANKYKKSNLFIINQENSGPSAARNTALKYCKEKFNKIDIVIFIDSDDYISPGYFKHCDDVFQKFKIDCYYSGTFTDQDSSIIKNIPKIRGFFNNSEAVKLLLDKKINCVLWNKAYKFDLFKDYQFPSVTLGEDFCANLHVFNSFINGVFIDDQCYYHYFVSFSQSSIMRSELTVKKSMDKILAAKIAYEDCKKNQKKFLFKNLLYVFLHETPFLIFSFKTNDNDKAKKYYQIKNWMKKQKYFYKVFSIRKFLWFWIPCLYKFIIFHKYKPKYNVY